MIGILLGAFVAASAPAPVEIVIFSDFQCPYCAMFAKPLRQVQDQGVEGVPVKVTFKHFPLAMHSKAKLAHAAAVAAAQQGRFWDMHDLLFTNQQRVERSDLLGYAKELGLDIPRFTRDLDSDKTRQAVDADTVDGDRLHVNATPTYYINGREYSGYMPIEALKRIVLDEDHRARAFGDVGDASMSLGAADAPITLELFADLRSPVSRPAVDALKRLVNARPADVRVQFRHFPLAFHPGAGVAHEASIAAARNGRFWEYADYLLDHPSPMTNDDLVSVAGRIGLDEASVAQTLQEHRYAARVDADLQSGLKQGLRGSPAILLDGRRIDGVPTLQTLTDLVNAALAARRQPDHLRKQ